MNPPRLNILTLMTTAFSRITVANGFQTDLGGNTFRGRIYFGNDDPLPMLALVEPPVTDIVPLMSPPGGPCRKSKWTVIVQGFVKSGEDHPCDPAYVFAAEVTQVLMEEAMRKNWGRTVTPFGLDHTIESVKIGPPIVRPSDNISSTAYFWMTVEFEIVEDLLHPMG